MANQKPRKNCSEKQNWYKLFNASVHMIKTQQTQLTFLVQERKFLEDTIQLHNQRRLSQVNLLKNQIFQMKEKMDMQAMELKVLTAKADSLMGLTKTEAYLLKHKLENADSELAAFREWFDILSPKMSEHKATSDNEKCGGNRLKALESEVKKLKCENEKLSLDKETEVSALQAEKNFIWNQYNKMESTFKEQLQEKSTELEQATQKIRMISNTVEELQSSNSEKDNALVGLKRDLAKLESDTFKKGEEISKLSKEVKSLKGSSRDFTSPLVRCTSGKGNNSANNMTVKRESRTNEKTRSSTRKRTRLSNISDSPPKLFTSSFKVPKVKRVCSRSTM